MYTNILQLNKRSSHFFLDNKQISEYLRCYLEFKVDRVCMYCVFHRFRKAKFAYGGSILSSSQFSILLQLPQKMKLASKVVKIDPKISVLLPKIKIPETHCRMMDLN